VPTYQYACTECGHGFETVQSFSDDALTECPQCTGRLRKVFNSVGIVFKGSGFYRTDSREKPKEAATASSKDGASGSKSDASKSDSTSTTSSSSDSSSTKSSSGSPGSSGSSSSGSSRSTSSAGSAA
jgi:putative FmdB family regulatory protein